MTGTTARIPNEFRLGLRVLAALAAATALLIGAAVLFAWSGLYDIAASGGHWKIVERFLEFGMRNSVTTNARGIEVPELDSPDLIRLGAGHFHRGCAFCHGAPGMPVNPIAERMLPAPPDLVTSMRSWRVQELFWIVKHGFKYTGMPAWVAIERDDEIWAVAAFLKTLPTLNAESYRDLALGNVRLAPRSGGELATFESNPEAISACARCHGEADEAPKSKLVPVLQGQPVGYLFGSLKAYAEGSRRSGIMQPLAADLHEEDMRNLAEYYASLPRPRGKTETVDPALLQIGRELALNGLPKAGIPPCASCHGHGEAPRLEGQHGPYLAGQLRLWKTGSVPRTAGARLMAPIAMSLSDPQIAALAAYFSAAHAQPKASLVP
jgi:cytochrome c553